MSGTDLSWYLKELRDEIRYLWEFHKAELGQFAAYNIGMLITAFWVTDMWNRAWNRGITWHIVNWFLDGFPGSGPDPLVVPFFFVGGLILVFPLDQYKRLQGTTLVVGTGTVVAMMSYFDRVQIVWNPPTIALASFCTAIGLGAGLRLGETDTRGLKSYDKAFSALWYIVLAICVYGFIEGHTAYNSPFIWGVGWVGFDVSSFAFKSTLPLTNEPTTAPLAAVITILDVIAVVGLLVILKEFTEYELSQNAIIIGPDRAGKTWLMGGAGYSLAKESSMSSSTLDPIPGDDKTNDLGSVKDDFDEGDFDSTELKATNELKRYTLQFNYGIIAKREVTVQCLDYPGERIKDAVFTGEDDARELYDKYYDNYDEFSLEDLDTQITGGDRSEKIGAIISAAVAKADTVGMVLPMDDFISGFTDDDIPDYLKPSDLNISRSTGRSKYLRKYKRVYKSYRNNKDLFFIATKSDVLLKKFDGNPRTRADWPEFRRLVWHYASLQDSTSTFEPGTSINMKKFYPEGSQPGPVYPVYLQGYPDPNKSRTKAGNFKPKLDWEDQRYALRGLKELLKALGR